jgi:hypothetical protein
MAVTQTNGNFSATVSEGGTPTFSLTGSITASGSVSGTYTVLNTTGPCLFFNVASGNFSASLVHAVTGTYGTGSVVLNIAQDQNFNVTGTGTWTAWTGANTLSISPSGAGWDLVGGYANVIGACLQGVMDIGSRFFGCIEGTSPATCTSWRYDLRGRPRLRFGR